MAQARISFAEKTVKKIMTNVISGTISKHWSKGRSLQYIGMQVTTGATAPTLSELEINGVDIFADGEEQCKVESDTAIDVHVYCNKEDGKEENGYLVVTA
jgi:hypothetical protein